MGSQQYDSAVLETASFLGGPEWIGYIALLAILAAVCVAGVRYRRCLVRGDTRRANQLRVNIGLGIFLLALVTIRVIVNA
jgi:hypothetical protein